MIDRLLSLLVAVSLSLLVWIYARSRDQEVLDNVPIPVQVLVNPAQADHYSLELKGPSQVPVSFTGPPQRMRELQGMLQRKELQIVLTITVPDERLNVNRYSDVAVLDPSAIHTPLGVNAIVPEGRNRLPFTLHRLDERWLPVKFVGLRDEPAGPIVIEPARVLVRGPKEILDRPGQCIPTQPADLPGQPGSSSSGLTTFGRVPLVDELDGRPVRVSPARVLVRCQGQMRKVYELTEVPVQFLCPPNFKLKPKFYDERAGKVTLRVQGPAQDEAPKVYAFIDLSRKTFASGLNHETLTVQLPRDFQLADDRPPVVGFELQPGDFSPGGLGIIPPVRDP